MKKSILFKALFLLLLAPLHVYAQSSYYHKVGDTIFGKDTIYYYQWWSDTWLSDTTHRLEFNYMEIAPTEIIFGLYEGGGYVFTGDPIVGNRCPNGELLQRFYSKNPLNIVGIATSLTVGGNHVERILGEPTYPQYLRLYEATEDSFYLVKEVPYDFHGPKRYMKTDYRFGIMDADCIHSWTSPYLGCHAPAPDCTRYIEIREHYFDKPVTVYDSFYMGYTTEGNLSAGMDPNIEWPSVGYINSVDGYSLSWDNSFVPDSNNPCETIPFFYHKYRNTHWDMDTNSPTYGDTIVGSNVWQWDYYPCFMLDFPILAIDSSYIIPPYECPPVESPRHANNVGGCAVLLWNSHPDHNSWQVSYGPEGTAPENGIIVNCPIQAAQLCGLDSGRHYTAYVRAVCNHDSVCYSNWSEPIDVCVCDTGTTEPESIVSVLDALTYIIPNPANDIVQILSSFTMNRIEAFNLNGEKMASITANGISSTLNVKGWSAGMYIIIIHTNAGNISKKLIVK